MKITFRHPVKGEDCSHAYVEHCHQLRHIHLYLNALRHLAADVGLIQESWCQFTCPYEGSKLHFDTLSKPCGIFLLFCALIRLREAAPPQQYDNLRHSTAPNPWSHALADRTSGRFSPLGIYEPDLVKHCHSCSSLWFLFLFHPRGTM
ncbi:hypothetical protein T05_15832 [Trichinella murrelli]|uniref:Uncharacterized protein n=1 Tax=Trichinella murrelli TaxID=144512 RepID=A0A0V0UHC3_9BILA|nr:hypothetical protein T05_15832 [Trichinella murrelli]